MADRPTRPEAGPSGDKIEVTPEMSRAGVEAFYLWDPSDNPEWVVWSVFQAMVKAQRRAKGGPEDAATGSSDQTS